MSLAMSRRCFGRQIPTNLAGNVRLTNFAWAFIALVATALASGFCWAVDNRIADAEQELRQLGQDFDSLWETYLSRKSNGPEYQKDMTDEEWLKLYRESAALPDPDSQMLPRFMAFAKNHRRSPLALDALALIIRRGGPANGDVRGPEWQLKEEAIEVIMEHHMDDARVIHVLDSLCGSIPSKQTESILRTTFEHGADRSTRAAAAFALARYLYYQSLYHRRSSQLKNEPAVKNSFDRHWKLVVTPYLEENFSYNHQKVTSEVDALLDQIAREYSDTNAPDWRISGPGKVFLSTIARKEPQTYGDLARELMRKRDTLAPGNRAPAISGRDADERPFRLRDFEGKVVLLTFSANWCAPCKKLYPIQRNLVEKFRNENFVLLSVSRDERVETLQAARESGEITWRCWWDGLDGPIGKAWSNTATPSIYLLNHKHVIQEAHLHAKSSQEDFERAIHTVLGEIDQKSLENTKRQLGDQR